MTKQATATRTSMSGHQSPHRGATDTWLTPPGILNAMGAFDLDPCCPPDMPWRTAETMLTAQDDGLSAEWNGRVWMNPPYGPATGQWLDKLASHGNGIALVFARTETRMFFDHAWERADAMLFIRGRLHFHSAEGERAKANAGAPSVLLAYGKQNAATLRDCGISGAFVGQFESVGDGAKISESLRGAYP